MTTADGQALLDLGWELLHPPGNVTQLPVACVLFDGRTRRTQALAVALEVLFGPSGAGRFYYNDTSGGVQKIVVTLSAIVFSAFSCLLLKPRDSKDASLGVRLVLALCWLSWLGIAAWCVHDAVSIGEQSFVPQPQDSYCLLPHRG